MDDEIKALIGFLIIIIAELAYIALVLSSIGLSI